MQLGTRWTSGELPPSAVPAALHSAIAAVDAGVAGDPGAHRPRWTLTWLERRPIAELDTGVVVALDASGAVIVETVDDEV